MNSEAGGIFWHAIFLVRLGFIPFHDAGFMGGP